MAESIEALEKRMDLLRAQVRQALIDGDRERAGLLRRGLREAENAWHTALATLERPPHGEQSSERMAERNAHADAGPAGVGRAAPGPPPPGRLLLPLREQVHQALTLLTVPASPRLISAVHEALFAGAISATRLTSLRRDEERSFRTAPFARPYYLCAALTADLLAPARGLLAISTWPMEQRVIGPLSPRVDYLTVAIQVAESLQRMPNPDPVSRRLLWRFAVNIPGGSAQAGQLDPADVARAAHAEMEIHIDADTATRRSAAARARRQLGDAEQLFGTRLRAVPQAGAGA
jgi:hypothetical protein